MDDKQEYLYSGDYVTIFAEVKDNDDFIVVNNGNGALEVARKIDLIKKEDSYQYKRAKEHADELRLITAKAQENLDKLADKLVDKALIALSSRLKFNTLFGKGSGNLAWAGLVIEELEKLVKEKAPDVISKKELSL